MLLDLGFQDKPTLIVFNKLDALEDDIFEERAEVRRAAGGMAASSCAPSSAAAR